MATELLYATSHLAGDFTNPNNALGNTPSTWAGVLNENTSVTSRWAIADPSEPLTPSATHTITVRARKGSNSGTPTIAINIYENGSLLSAGSAQNVTSTTGQNLTRTFNTSLVNDPANLEIEIVVSAAGGNPNTRNSAQVALIEWTADVTPVIQDHERFPEDNAGLSDVGGYSGMRGEHTVAISDDVDYTLDAATGDHTRARTDELSATDDSSQEFSSSRSATDSAELDDATDRSVGSGRSRDDEIELEDSQERFIDSNKLENEDVELDDSSERSWDASRAAEELLGVDDDVERRSDSGRVADSALTVEDDLGYTLTQTRDATDSVAVEDSVDRASTSTRLETDSGELTDSVESGAELERSLTDAPQVVDSATTSQAFLFEAFLTDNTELEDTSSSSQELERSLDDVVEPSDDVEGLWEPPEAVDYERDVDDTMAPNSLVEYQAISPGFINEELTDGLGASDEADATAGAERRPEDVFGSLDAVGRVSDASRIVEDQLEASDQVFAGEASNLERSVEDGINLSDEPERSTDLARSVTGQIALDELVGITRGIQQNLIDALGLEDDVARTAVQIVWVSEYLLITEEVLTSAGLAVVRFGRGQLPSFRGRGRLSTGALQSQFKPQHGSGRFRP